MGIKNKLAQYCITFVVVLAVTGVKLLVPGLGSDAPSTLYMIAIILCASLFGAYPAMFATLLSALAATIFFIPHHYGFSLEPKDIIQSLTVVAEGTLITWLIYKARKLNIELANNREQLRQMNETLLNTVQEIVDKELGQYQRDFKIPRKK